MSKKEIKNRLANGELPVVLAKEAWERKLEIVKQGKFHSYHEFEKYLKREDIDSECPLCYVYIKGDCVDCPLYKMDDCCLDDESTYDNVYTPSGYAEFVDAVIEMINVLDKAVKLEMSDKNEN